MKQTYHHLKYLFTVCAALFFLFSITSVQAQAAEKAASVSVNRTSGNCTYTVTGIDVNETSSLTLQVLHKETKASALQTNIPLTDANCVNGTYIGSFSLDSLNYNYDNYIVNVIAGTDTLVAGECDFSIHTGSLSMSFDGNTGSASRVVSINTTEAAGGVVIPGTDKMISVAAWPVGTDESTAKTIAGKTAFTEGNMSLTADVSKAGTAYGSWNTKLILENSKTGAAQTVSTGSYTVSPTQTSFYADKSTSFEKKQTFRITLRGLKNAYGIKKVTFQIYNSKGTKVSTVSGVRKTTSGSKYTADVTMKKLGYKLDAYSIQALLTDNNGNTQTLSLTALANQRAQGGTLSVTKKNNATTLFKLTNAYLPGNIKKLRFVVYNSKGKKQETIEVKKTAGKKIISAKMQNEDTGKFKVRVYGYTTWGKKVFLNEQSYRLQKKHLGKNGWFYERYNKKKYKFYYVNNVKQTDLTKVLKLKKSSGTNTNKMQIEINRAASVVTIYLYNEETKKYDIPIKTCAVSVGSDTWTNAGTSGLNEDSSYTPLGNYSVCTNGQSVKYTLKPMNEPDGSILFARWTTHIVGNIYFHSIAVGTQSHYALPSSTYNRLGSPASAGCIRMTVADAKWIYDYVSTGTPVKIVKGDSKRPGPLGKNAVIKTTAGINYDPTDPAVPDSRKKKDYKAKRITGYMTKSGKRVGY